MKTTKCYRQGLPVGTQMAVFLALAMSLCIEAQANSLSYKGIDHDAFYDICFQGGSGLVVGNNGLVLQSEDSGNSWAPLIVSDESIAMLGVDCLENRGVIVGQEGRIFTGKAGTWSRVESGTEERLLSVEITESGLGIATGAFGTVLRTQDGGLTWGALAIDWEAVLQDFIEPHIYDVAISDAGVVTIVGEFGLVLQSEDDGDNWKAVRRAEASLFTIHFSDADHGYAAGQNGQVIHTKDGGRSWTPVDVGSTSNLLGIWSSPQGEVVITGIRTMLRSSDGGLSWRRVVSGDFATNWYQGVAQATGIVTRENITVAAEKVFVVGNSGKIIQIFE